MPALSSKKQKKEKGGETVVVPPSQSGSGGSDDWVEVSPTAASEEAKKQAESAPAATSSWGYLGLGSVVSYFTGNAAATTTEASPAPEHLAEQTTAEAELEDAAVVVSAEENEVDGFVVIEERASLVTEPFESTIPRSEGTTPEPATEDAPVRRVLAPLNAAQRREVEALGVITTTQKLERQAVVQRAAQQAHSQKPASTKLQAAIQGGKRKKKKRNKLGNSKKFGGRKANTAGRKR